jgi:hypothetical protein
LAKIFEGTKKNCPAVLAVLLTQCKKAGREKNCLWEKRGKKLSGWAMALFMYRRHCLPNVEFTHFFSKIGRLKNPPLFICSYTVHVRGNVRFICQKILKGKNCPVVPVACSSPCRMHTFFSKNWQTKKNPRTLFITFTVHQL